MDNILRRFDSMYWVLSSSIQWYGELHGLLDFLTFSYHGSNVFSRKSYVSSLRCKLLRVKRENLNDLKTA